MNRPLPGATRDVALLLTRLLLGTIMFAHGYQKLMIDGLGRTTEGFESMSIPVAIFSAAFVTVVEVVGGVLVVLGALIPVVAACYLVVMVGAAVFVHIPNGIFVAPAAGSWSGRSRRCCWRWRRRAPAATAWTISCATGRRAWPPPTRRRRSRRPSGPSTGRPPGATTRRARRRSSSRRPTAARTERPAACGAVVASRPGPDGARRPRCDHAGMPASALRHVTAIRYVTPLREGGSLPGLMEADDLGTYVVKYSGAGQGLPVLVAEVVSGELARGLGLPVPELVTVELDPALGVAEPDQEVQDLLRRSPGLQPRHGLPARSARPRPRRVPGGPGLRRAGAVVRRARRQRRPHVAQRQHAALARRAVPDRPRRRR